jgi:hypothetical protein
LELPFFSSYSLLESGLVLPDSHGQRKQLFERFVGVLEGDLDTAGREFHSRRQSLEIIFIHGSQHPGVGVHKNRRRRHPPPALFLQLCPNPLATFLFVVDCFAGSEPLQMLNKRRALDHAAAAVPLCGEWLENFLRPAAADMKKLLNRGAVYPWDRQLF